MREMQINVILLVVFIGVLGVLAEGNENETLSVDPGASNRFIANDQIQELYVKVKKDLEKATKEISDKNLEFLTRFVNWEKDSFAAQEAILNEAEENGGNKDKIVKCMAIKTEIPTAKIKAQWNKIDECRVNATKSHKKDLEDLRKDYWTVLTNFSMQEYDHKIVTASCNETKEDDCITKADDELAVNFNNTMQEGQRVLKIIEETPKKYNTQLEICFEGFFDQLNQFKNDTIPVLQQCMDKFTSNSANEAGESSKST